MSDQMICLEALSEITVAMTRVQPVGTVLETVVKGLAVRPGVALARMWLRAAGDICDACSMGRVCPDHRECLHLVASAGTSLTGEEWSQTVGDFSRFPLGVCKVGIIGQSGESLCIPDVTADGAWIARPEWARREAIASFGGHPLVYGGEILGVLSIFTRIPLTDDNFRRLRLYADQAAVAIANARAFEEIERMRAQLELENGYLRETVETELAFGEIVGKSPALQKVLHQVELVAPTDAAVLIQGESGTGKELIARAIHDRSGRRNRPLVKVNCAAVAPELFESEFFGHVKGAFTGAIRDRIGRFQLADGGTLFLDEIGEIPLGLQGKLLRVLQEGEFERVGEDRPRKINVRMVAATNLDLKKAVDAGRFRLDLFYRLSVFPIELPPLRERREDIPSLARHFLNVTAKRLRCPTPGLSSEAIVRLQANPWPGNIRELQNAVERAVIQAQCGRRHPDFSFLSHAPDQSPTDLESPSPRARTEAEMREMEKRNLLTALRQANGKVSGAGGAAEILGVKPSTFASRLKAFGIKSSG
jgi:transcriptional regulator with GAF, ATPase, and Fis domain